MHSVDEDGYFVRKFLPVTHFFPQRGTVPLKKKAKKIAHGSGFFNQYFLFSGQVTDRGEELYLYHSFILSEPGLHFQREFRI